MSDFVIVLKKQSVLDTVSEAAVVLFLLLTAFVRIVSNSSAALMLCTVMLLAAGFLNLFLAATTKYNWVVLFAFLLVGCWIIEYFCRPEWSYELNSLIDSVGFIGIACSFIRMRKSVLIYTVLYYLVAGIMMIRLFILKVPLKKFMVDNTSFNYISILLLFYLLLLNYVQWQNDKEPQYIPAVIFFIVCVFAKGRGGMITAAIYLVLLMFFKAGKYKRSLRILIGVILIAAFLIIFGSTLYHRVLSAGLLNKFLRRGLESNGRFELWGWFFRDCFSSLSSFFLGGHPDQISFKFGNLHNSFLQIYSSFGFVYFAVTIFLFVRGIVNMIRNKDWFMLLAAITFSARAFTDKLLYRGYFEIIFCLILFYDLARDARSRWLQEEDQGAGLV